MMKDYSAQHGLLSSLLSSSLCNRKLTLPFSDVHNELTSRFPHIKQDDDIDVLIPNPSNPTRLARPSSKSRNNQNDPNTNGFKSLDNLLDGSGGMLSPSAFDSTPVDTFRRPSNFDNDTRTSGKYDARTSNGSQKAAHIHQNKVN